MANEVKFNSKSLLEIKFEKDVKGYNPLQVDQTLDEVIGDYKHFEEFTSKANSEIAALHQEITNLKEKNRQMEILLAESKNKIHSLPNDKNVSQDNITLLKRIDALERALYQKGVDPKKI